MKGEALAKELVLLQVGACPCSKHMVEARASQLLQAAQLQGPRACRWPVDLLNPYAPPQPTPGETAEQTMFRHASIVAQPTASGGAGAGAGAALQCTPFSPQPLIKCGLGRRSFPPAEAQIQATVDKLIQWTKTRLAWLADQFAAVAQGGAGGSTLQLPASVVATGASPTTGGGTASAAGPAGAGNGAAPAPSAVPGPGRPSPVSSYSAGVVPLLG